MPAPVHVHRPAYELGEDVEVDVGEALDIEAALARRVRTESFQQPRVSFGESTDQVDGDVAAAGCKARERGVAFVPARVAIVVDAEADDARPPQHRRLPGDLREERAKGSCVVAAAGVRDRLHERLDIRARGLRHVTAGPISKVSA
jgi:hypothetical protein